MRHQRPALGKMFDPEAVDGAVDLAECPHRICVCGFCARCGYAKHSHLHGPVLGQGPGSKPVGHKFVGKRES